jgi:hypothetical protein
MRLVVIFVAALTIVGVAALGLILAQKRSTPTATAASSVYTASVTQEVSALPARAPVSQIAKATGSEASPLILQANVDAQAGSPMTTVTQAPSAAAAAPNVKDQSPSTISKAMVYETTRLKDDATGWAHKLQELELDLKLQLDLKKNQDVEATGKNINECLVVLRAAAGRLAPDAEARVTLRKQRSPFATLRSARRCIRTRRFARLPAIFTKWQRQSLLRSKISVRAESKQSPAGLRVTRPALLTPRLPNAFDRRRSLVRFACRHVTIWPHAASNTRDLKEAKSLLDELSS